MEFDECYNMIVDDEDSDIRIDKYLSEIFPELSRTYIQKLIKNGCVLLNSKQVKPNCRIADKDTVEVTFPELSVPDIVPENIPIEVVYDDNDIIIINKAKHNFK